MSSAIGLPPGALEIRWTCLVLSALHLYLYSVATLGVKYIFSNKLQFDKLLTGDDDLTNWGVKFEVEKKVQIIM